MSALEISREEFKHDPVFHKIYMLIKNNHKVANHTERTLRKNKHIKDFCEEARHFWVLPGNTTIYLHYDVASWWKDPNGVQVRIERIGLYNSKDEYEQARRQQLNSTPHADGANLN